MFQEYYNYEIKKNIETCDWLAVHNKVFRAYIFGGISLIHFLNLKLISILNFQKVLINLPFQSQT